MKILNKIAKIMLLIGFGFTIPFLIFLIAYMAIYGDGVNKTINAVGFGWLLELLMAVILLAIVHRKLILTEIKTFINL